MITDPIPYESVGESWEYKGSKVTRGSCFLTSHAYLQGGAARRGRSPLLSMNEATGLRLSLSLPCNGAGSVVQ